MRRSPLRAAFAGVLALVALVCSVVIRADAVAPIDTAL
jgi:hypothetical protein